jgi:hypothetical protein
VVSQHGSILRGVHPSTLDDTPDIFSLTGSHPVFTQVRVSGETAILQVAGVISPVFADTKNVRMRVH